MPRTKSEVNSLLASPSEKKRSFKDLPQIFGEKRESVVFLSKNKMQRFKVFLDEEVGLSFQFTKTLHDTDGDEDFSSSEEIIQDGLKRCLKILKINLNGETKTVEEASKESQASEFVETISKHKEQFLSETEEYVPQERSSSSE